MDLTSYLVFGVIAFISGLLTAIASVGYLKKSLFFENILENLIIDLGNDEDLQKSLFLIGGMIGQGAKSGLGIDMPKVSKGGRFNLQSFLVEMASNYIQTKIANPSLSPQAPQTLPPQVLSASKKTDKW